MAVRFGLLVDPEGRIPVLEIKGFGLPHVEWICSHAVTPNTPNVLVVVLVEGSGLCRSLQEAQTFYPRSQIFLASEASSQRWTLLPVQIGRVQAQPADATVSGRGLQEASIVGSSSAMDRIRGAIRRVAASNVSVLLTGESGTGKELAAEMIHRNSPRSSGPLVAVNCAALPDSLLESELFGYSKGAFTGASQASAGRFCQADGGTLFLDEIGDMTMYAQSKILRVLETRSVDPLGWSIGRQCRHTLDRRDQPQSSKHGRCWNVP